MMEQYDALEDFKWMPHRTITYIEVRFDKKIYHFPLKFLVLYQIHEHPKEILPLIQDSIRIMKEK